jgi:hypothetical protein
VNRPASKNPSRICRTGGAFLQPLELEAKVQPSESSKNEARRTPDPLKAKGSATRKSKTQSPGIDVPEWYDTAAHGRQRKSRARVRHLSACRSMKLGFDGIGPFAFLDWFRDEWLVSQRACRFFLIAVPFVLALTPIFFGWVTVTRVTLWMQFVGGVLGVLGPIAVFFLWLGMWRYWMKLDRSKGPVKRVWFVIMLIGFWYGSILYYFFVYRPQVRSLD